MGLISRVSSRTYRLFGPNTYKKTTLSYLAMSANLAAQNNEELWGKKWEKFATNAIHVGQDPEKWKSRMVVPPITLSTTFKQLVPGEGQYEYSRSGNPTRDCLEECLAAIEGGSHG